MRTSAVCVQGPMKTKKRKALTDDCNNNFPRLKDSRCNKENINATTNNNNNNNNIVEQDNVNYKNSPKTKRFHHERKPLTITQEFIKIICDKVKSSAKRIMPINIYEKNTRSANELFKTGSEETEAPSKNSSDIQPDTKSLSKDALSLPTSHCPPNVATRPLMENFSFIKEKLVKKEEIQLPKISLSNLPKYLEGKRSLLRRSKTNILPTHAVCSGSDINKFLWLIEEDPMVSLFLKRDVCRRYADKYLLAMVLIYFARAQLSPVEFNRENFFAALYLAHDVEEDNEEMKYEVFPYCLGTKWKRYYTYMLSIRDDLFWALDCRAVVSRKCCEQVMSLIPGHWIWERERPEYHAGVIRTHSMASEYYQPRGPYNSPLWCRTCLERECSDSDNSYIVYTSLSDTSPESQESEESPDASNHPKKDSGFESGLLFMNEDDEDDDFQSPEVMSSVTPTQS